METNIGIAKKKKKPHFNKKTSWLPNHGPSLVVLIHGDLIEIHLSWSKATEIQLKKLQVSNFYCEFTEWKEYPLKKCSPT